MRDSDVFKPGVFRKAVTLALVLVVTSMAVVLITEGPARESVDVRGTTIIRSSAHGTARITVFGDRVGVDMLAADGPLTLALVSGSETVSTLDTEAGEFGELKIPRAGRYDILVMAIDDAGRLDGDVELAAAQRVSRLTTIEVD